LLEDELIACLSKQHNKAQKSFLNAEDFSEETYITNSVVPEKDREYELFFKPNQVVPKKVLQVGFNEAIMELVKVNMGVTIFSKQLASPFLADSKIVAIPLTEKSLPVYWHLVFLKQDNIAEPAMQFKELLKSYANT